MSTWHQFVLVSNKKPKCGDHRPWELNFSEKNHLDNNGSSSQKSVKQVVVVQPVLHDNQENNSSAPDLAPSINVSVPPPWEVESDNDSIILLRSEEEKTTIPETILTRKLKLDQSLRDTTGMALAFYFFK